MTFELQTQSKPQRQTSLAQQILEKAEELNELFLDADYAGIEISAYRQTKYDEARNTYFNALVVEVSEP